MVLEQIDWKDSEPLEELGQCQFFKILDKEAENRLDFICMLHKAIFTYPGGGE